MKVAIDTIGPQGLPLERKGHRGPWLEATLADAGGLRAPAGADVHLKLTRNGEQVRIAGDVTVAFEGPCSRCAEDLQFGLFTSIDVTLVPAEKQPAALDSGEIRGQDIDLGAYVDAQVDVGSILHDELILDMPSQILCTDKCLGLCGACGVNRNDTPCGCADAISPTSPFAPLAKLKTP